MKRYEKLIYQAQLCKAASFRVRGQMRTMWQMKANELIEKASELTVEEAGEEVDEQKES